MCVLSDYIEENCLSVTKIRKYVDDYSVISHYIGEELELRRVYPSPLRTSDEHHSFSIYEAKDGNIVFKDHGRNIKGNVYKFVRYLLSEDKANLIPFNEVLHQINLDFDLGLGGTPKTFQPRAKRLETIKRPNSPVKIEIVSKMYTKPFLDFFSLFGISATTLHSYNVYNVREYRINQFSNFPKTLCIAYKIGKYYKIYKPFEDKNEKFRTDFPQNYVEGFIQLKYHKDFVIITKSLKEVMFFREHFDWDTVAGKSENTMIPKFIMESLFSRYKTVYIWLDRDNGGKDALESYMIKYPKLVPINYDSSIIEKDPTDRYKYLKILHKEDDALQEIKKLIT